MAHGVLGAKVQEQKTNWVFSILPAFVYTAMRRLVVVTSILNKQQQRAADTLEEQDGGEWEDGAQPDAATSQVKLNNI